MGVRHRTFAIEAVQYHPESVLSEEGDSLLKNFLSLRGGTWNDNPSVRATDVSLPPFPIDLPNGKPVASSSSGKLPSILEKIHSQRLKDIDAAKKTPGTTPTDIDKLLAMHLAPPLINVLDRMRTTPETSPALMAEVKRASPSKGPIAMNTNAAQQALTYALAGASVISVLTEPTWFKGSLLDMRLARQAIDALPNRPAVLRKDFIVDEYQIAEARLHGADTVLLIVAMLPEARLQALYTYAQRLGMEPLVEVNNAAEMRAALSLGARLIGVNNRNLHTFEVDMKTTTRLSDMVKDRSPEESVILCALSGIAGPADVQAYKAQGVSAVLVGEALMRASDTTKFIRELLGWQLPVEVVGSSVDSDRPPLVKICGIRTVEEALAAADAGADMLGLMFAATSKRCLSLDVARQIALAIRKRRAEADATTLPTATKDSSVAQERNTPWFETHASAFSRNLTSGTRPQLIGVFQDQPLEYVRAVAAAVQLDAVQLHGREPAHWATQLPVPVIRVFPVRNSKTGTNSKEGNIVEAAGLKDIARPGLHQFVLLDAARADGLSGGSGVTLDWDVARAVADAGESYTATVTAAAVAKATNVNEDEESKKSRLPVILAGGLTPENVTEAVGRVRPWAVDVSGGVETADGKGKDAEKVAAFVRNAKTNLKKAVSGLAAVVDAPPHQIEKKEGADDSVDPGTVLVNGSESVNATPDDA